MFFASNAPIDLSRIETQKDVAKNDPIRAFVQWEVLTDPKKGVPITDARNPMSTFQLESERDHFAAMRELLPRAVWQYL